MGPGICPDPVLWRNGSVSGSVLPMRSPSLVMGKAPNHVRVGDRDTAVWRG